MTKAGTSGYLTEGSTPAGRWEDERRTLAGAHGDRWPVHRARHAEALRLVRRYRSHRHRSNDGVHWDAPGKGARRARWDDGDRRGKPVYRRPGDAARVC